MDFFNSSIYFFIILFLQDFFAYYTAIPDINLHIFHVIIKVSKFTLISLYYFFDGELFKMQLHHSGSWHAYYSDYTKAYKLPHAVVYDAFIAYDTKSSGKKSLSNLMVKNLTDKTNYPLTSGNVKNTLIPRALDMDVNLSSIAKLSFNWKHNTRANHFSFFVFYNELANWTSLKFKLDLDRTFLLPFVLWRIYALPSAFKSSLWFYDEVGWIRSFRGSSTHEMLKPCCVIKFWY